MKDDRAYLEHIQDCIERIQRYTSDGKQDFLKNTKTQDAVLRNLQTLAESARRLSKQFIEANPSIPWKNIVGFRNVLVHDYLGVDLQQIWKIVTNDLPPLRDIVHQGLTGN